MDGEREDLDTATPTEAGVAALLANTDAAGAVAAIPEDTPPGAEGADSGAAEVVTVDPAD